MLKNSPEALPTGGVSVVFDIEYTSWADCNPGHDPQPGRYPEIIQIGAVKIDLDNGLTEVDAFDVIVIPTVNPMLSEHIVDLTGITQAILDEKGKPFAAALSEFEAFIGADTTSLMSYGYDADIVRDNCTLNGLPMPTSLPAEYDLFSVFVSKGLVPRRVSSGELAAWLELSTPGHTHDALHDARALAAAYRHFRKLGKI